MQNRLENIFLMRHGLSKANEDLGEYKITSDHKIILSPTGKEQVLAAGAWFRNYLYTGPMNIESGQIRMWTSDYYRAIESSDGFLKGFNRPNFFRDVRKDILLNEQRFGYFDGLSDEERAAEYPKEFEKFKRQGKFYGQPPAGESRYDVCMRVRPFFGTIIRDA